jgi:hypothetical protein
MCKKENCEKSHETIKGFCIYASRCLGHANGRCLREKHGPIDRVMQGLVSLADSLPEKFREKPKPKEEVVKAVEPKEEVKAEEPKPKEVKPSPWKLQAKQLPNPDLKSGGGVAKPKPEEEVVAKPKEEEVVAKPNEEVKAVEPKPKEVKPSPWKQQPKQLPNPDLKSGGGVAKPKPKEEVVAKPIEEEVVAKPIEEEVVAKPKEEEVVAKPKEEVTEVAPELFKHGLMTVFRAKDGKFYDATGLSERYGDNVHTISKILHNPTYTKRIELPGDPRKVVQAPVRVESRRAIVQIMRGGESAFYMQAKDRQFYIVTEMYNRFSTGSYGKTVDELIWTQLHNEIGKGRIKGIAFPI